MGRTIGSDDGRDRIAGKARHAPQPAACVCGVGVVCVLGIERSWRPLTRLPSVTTLKAVLTKMLELRCRGGGFIISLFLFMPYLFTTVAAWFLSHMFHVLPNATISNSQNGEVV